MPQFIRTEEQAITDTEALKLRSRGATFQQIADTMGCSKGAAYQRVSRALAAIPQEAVEEYRKLECERLDMLLAVAFQKAINEKSMTAVDRCVLLMERKSKLMGYDAPIRQQVETITYDGSTIEARVGEIRLAFEQLSIQSLSMDGSTSETRAITD